MGDLFARAGKNSPFEVRSFKGTIDYKHNGAAILIPVGVDDKVT
jgi:hypothetical protein